MKREAINPWEWGLQWQMNQAELLTDCTQQLHFSGQVAVVEDQSKAFGIKIVHPNNIRGQIQSALDNIDSILTEAGFERRDLVAIRFLTTDMDGFLENYDIFAAWISSADIKPVQSLMGVTCLFLPELKIEIEALAAK